MIILGLAIATSQHHAAALVIDGQVVGAVEEERLNGIKAYGWHPPGRPQANLLNTDGLAIGSAVCRQSVNLLLGRRGLGLEDVDIIALNGIPFRFQPTRECVREGRYVFVPHHLAHAAAVARPSPFDRGNVLTVDGRGEYETAAFFSYEGGELVRQRELPAGDGCSIGGVYETVTRVLGFGPNGQGQTMALASLVEGDPGRVAEAFQVNAFDDYTIDEHALQRLSQARMAGATRLDGPEGQGLAADLQAALENALVALARDGMASNPSDRILLSGGVALNCCANSKIRDELGVDVWVTHAAHDAGTALGAALEAAHLVGEPPTSPISDAGLGPSFGREPCAKALSDAGLQGTENALPLAAERILRGDVLGFFQSGMEFGPRALGHRSIVAHAGRSGIADRVNRIKGRQPWRPFGPAVLAERALDVFEDDAFGPFMTFTTTVRDSMREKVAGIVHRDGSTRPQSVGADADPAWRRLIELVDEATGIPLVLNTSFNGRGKPIVCDPKQAIEEAQILGLDGLVLGDVFVDLPSKSR